MRARIWQRFSNWSDGRHQTVRAVAGTRRVSAFWPHHITRRPTLGLPLSLAQHSARPNAEVGGSSPPRPTNAIQVIVGPPRAAPYRPRISLRRSHPVLGVNASLKLPSSRRSEIPHLRTDFV